ncbi:SIS domain-containing protein [Marinoscillum sp.]|uniref:SIS domain-containing protein n=1 Tax=Marinoscillum sp. TaxID=2024838 RepID=UPI003BA922B5
MQYLGVDEKDLKSLGGLHTAQEIAQQPDTWKKVFKMVLRQKNELTTFLTKAKNVDQVILTGAGTSAFIGESLIGSYYRNFNNCTKAVPTTNLVSHPYDYLSNDQETLLISFARSGNSPESKGAVELADKLCGKCTHLIITCNKDGDLANYETKNGKYVFLLPEETNDQSLAMTSSYSCMLLAGLLMAHMDRIEDMEAQVNLAAAYGKEILDNQLGLLKNIAGLPFKRAVFLGSGPLLGTANESHLKVQELTDGGTVCKHDSFLGFRHGPKAVVDTETLIVHLLSNNQYVSKYENDLIFAMEKGKKALVQLAIGEGIGYNLPVDYTITYSSNDESIDEDFLCLPGVLPGQILGFFKSLNEHLMPDEPSSSGAISRVVQGVNIYNLP